MTKCKHDVDNSDYLNNGLITKIWGGPGWVFNHSVTFGYPLQPTDEQKENYKNYFTSLGDVLPCRYCRESYKNFISSGDTKLTDEALSNRSTLTKWFYNIHEAVNKKLDVNYGITYDDLIDKYESFRAKCVKNSSSQTSKGCVAPLDYKAFSFKKLYQYDAPIIPLSIVDIFVPVARERGLSEEYFDYYNLAKYLDGNIEKLKKLSWNIRNNYCQIQIRYMREKSINSIEQEGKWKGTPTIDELKLILFMSSNLSNAELTSCVKCLNDMIDKQQKIEKNNT